jgi:predicted transcriptional regulator
LYYGSIVYHVAELLKNKNISVPRNVVFSGTSSKALNIFEMNGQYQVLETFFQSIFNDIHNIDNSNIEIITYPNPKEITSKGAFYPVNKKMLDLLNNPQESIKLAQVNIGSKTNPLVQEVHDTNPKITYNSIDDAYIKGVNENVNDFYELFTKLIKNLNLKQHFGITSKSIAVFEDLVKRNNDEFTKDQLGDIKKGLKIARSSDEGDSLDNDEPITETLFFYALKELIPQLTSEINDKAPIN